MRRYEAMIIVKPDMADEDLKKTLGSIEEAITKNEGKVQKCDKWARRRLAYSIKRHVEGDYYLCEFEAEPKAISPIESAYKLNDNIIRTLVIVKSSER